MCVRVYNCYACMYHTRMCAYTVTCICVCEYNYHACMHYTQVHEYDIWKFDFC